MGVNAKVTGEAEWEKKISKITKNALADVAERTEARGRGMRWRARQNAPKITGALRRSIQFKITNTKTSTSIKVFTDSPYAQAVEYGYGKKAPKPYMKPAFDEYSVKYVDEDIRIALKKAIRNR